MKLRFLLALSSMCISISLAAQVSPRYPFKVGPLRAGDVLRITIFKAPNSKTKAQINLTLNAVTIRDDGAINMPLLENIPAEGQTISQFVAMLEKRYTEYFLKAAPTDNTPPKVTVHFIGDKTHRPPKTSLEQLMERIGK